MTESDRLVIPDTSSQNPPPYTVRERPAFTPPPEPPLHPHELSGWNRQAAPDLVFGVPRGWSEVPAANANFFGAEREHIKPDAPLIASTRIVAAVERPSAGGHPWSVQLRRYAASAAGTVMQNPVNWAKAKSQWAEALGSPVYRTVAGDPAIMLRYAYTSEDVLFVLYEVWLGHGGGGYHFMATGPADDEARLWPEWEAMLASGRSEPSPTTQPQPPQAPSAPAIHYRCGVRTQVPVTLGNVSSTHSPMLLMGSPALVAWSVFGAAAARLYGSARAQSLEGQTIAVPAGGEAMLMDDRVVLRVIADARAKGISLRGDPSQRSVDLEIPYRTIRAFGTDSRGVWLDVVGRGAVWVQPQDGGEFSQWLAHLSYNRTWQPLQPLGTAPDVQIVGWCQQDPRYTFGLPQGWGQAPAAALADYAREFLPRIVRCAVGLNGGPWEAQVFVIEDGPSGGPADSDSLAATILSATNIAQVGPAQATSIGGEPAALVRGTSWTTGGPVERCYGMLAHGGILYDLWYGTVGTEIGDGSYERCVADFHTMLATWHWYT